MTTSKILNLVVNMLKVYQGGTRSDLLFASAEIELAKMDHPYEFQLAIQAIQRAAAQADVTEHLAADEECT